QLIRLAIAQGDLPKATQLVAQAIGANPDNTDLLLVKAGLENDQENFASARELVHAVLDREPGNISAANLLTHLALTLRDVKEAEQQNSAVLKKYPDQEEAKILQAGIYQIKQQPAEAIRVLEEYRKTPRGKESVKAAIRLADLYGHQKEFAKGEQLL